MTDSYRALMMDVLTSMGWHEHQVRKMIAFLEMNPNASARDAWHFDEGTPGAAPPWHWQIKTVHGKFIRLFELIRIFLRHSGAQ